MEQLKQQLLEYSKEIKDTFSSDYTETVDKNNGLTYSVQKGEQIDMEWKPQLLLSNTLLPY